MDLPLPSDLVPAFSSDRLQMVADWLLEEYYATEDDLTRDTDSSYGRGCTTFDRQKNRIISEWKSGKHDWLGLKSGRSFAVVPTIGGVPCRFSNDDPANPTKDAVLLANHHQAEFLEFVEDDEAGQFCFILDRYTGGDARVEFHGFTPTGAMACRWVSAPVAVRVLRPVSVSVRPPAVEIKKPVVQLKSRTEETDLEAANDATGKPAEGT
jgi:hypothetical protein